MDKQLEKNRERLLYISFLNLATQRCFFFFFSFFYFNY